MRDYVDKILVCDPYRNRLLSDGPKTDKIVARIVSPLRFSDKGHFLSYAGLIKLDKISGGRSYGKRRPRFCRMMKAAYKSAVMAAIGSDNFITDYYRYLIESKNYVEHIARHKACRRLAILSYGVFKSGKPLIGPPLFLEFIIAQSGK